MIATVSLTLKDVKCVITTLYLSFNIGSMFVTSQQPRLRNTTLQPFRNSYMTTSSWNCWQKVCDIVASQSWWGSRHNHLPLRENCPGRQLKIGSVMNQKLMKVRSQASCTSAMCWGEKRVALSSKRSAWGAIRIEQPTTRQVLGSVFLVPRW